MAVPDTPGMVFPGWISHPRAARIGHWAGGASISDIGMRERNETPGDAADEALVRRALGGEEAAFALAFDRHAQALAGRVRHAVPPEALRRISVSDVLQEVRIVAFRRLGDFEARGEGSFRRWLMRIVELKLREANRYARAAKRSGRREVTRGQRASTAEVAGRGRSPSEVAIGAERSSLVREALATLREDHRTVLELAGIEGLALGEVAVRMERSREAVKKLYGRALANFTRACRRLGGAAHD